MQEQTIAYFVAETSASPNPSMTTSGGLGVLSGDIIRGSADLGVPLVAVSLKYNKGHFDQVIEGGCQREKTYVWNPSPNMKKLNEKVKIKIGDAEPEVSVWQYDVKGIGGHVVPVLFLDTDSEENKPDVRSICDNLYWDGKEHNNGDADKWYRLQQEMVLGVAGAKFLKALGYAPKKYNINESHAALLLLELLKENNWDREKTKAQSSFITHTPVPAGHERFPKHMVRCALEESFPADVIEELGGEGNEINMSKLAKNLSGSMFAVSKKHAEVTREMFPNTEIGYVTNAVHLPTWTSESYKQLFNKYLPG
jgi:starch phosphorylase